MDQETARQLRKLDFEIRYTTKLQALMDRLFGPGNTIRVLKEGETFEEVGAQIRGQRLRETLFPPRPQRRRPR